MVNVNATATITTTGGSIAGADVLLTDGDIFTHGTSHGRYWARDANTDSATATYSEAKTIGSIGIGLSLDNVRAQPSEILVSYDGGSEIIQLRGDNLQYGTYDLAGPVTTSFLTITMPDGSSSAGWFFDGADQNYGLTEFQAFEVIPEPASIAFIGCGLLTILSRRHRI